MGYYYAIGALAVVSGVLGYLLLRATGNAARADAEAKQEVEHAARLDTEKALESARQAQGDVERQILAAPADAHASSERMRKLRDNQ